MKIELDYIRELLIEIDRQLDTEPEADLWENEDNAHKRLCVHLDYMSSNKMIRSKAVTGDSGIPIKYFVYEITAAARQFLDSVREEKDYISFKNGGNNKADRAIELLAKFVGLSASEFLKNTLTP